MITCLDTFASRDTVVACVVDGAMVWTAELNGFVRRRSVSDFTVAQHHRLPRGVDPTALVAVDGRLWVGRSDGAITVLDVAMLEHVRDCYHHDESITALCSLPQGRIASSCAAGVVAIWDTSAFSCQSSRRLRRGGPINCLGFSASAQALVAHDDDHQIVCLGVTEQTLPTTARISGHEREVLCIAVMGARAWSSSQDETVRCWDMNRSALLMVLTHHRAPVHHIALIGKKTLCSASLDGAYALWDTDSGTLQHTESVSQASAGEDAFDAGSTRTSASTRHFAFCVANVGYIAVPRLWMTVTNGTVLGLSVNTTSAFDDMEIVHRDDAAALRSRVPFTEQELGAFMFEKKALFEGELSTKDCELAARGFIADELLSCLLSLQNHFVERLEMERLRYSDALERSTLHAIRLGDQWRASMHNLHEEAAEERRKSMDDNRRLSADLADTQHRLEDLDRQYQEEVTALRKNEVILRSSLDNLEKEHERAVRVAEESVALVADLEHARSNNQDTLAALNDVNDQLSLAYKMLSDATSRESQKEQLIMELEEERSAMQRMIGLLTEEKTVMEKSLDEVAARNRAAIDELSHRLDTCECERDEWMKRFYKLEEDVTVIQEERSSAMTLNEQLHLAVQQLRATSEEDTAASERKAVESSNQLESVRRELDAAIHSLHAADHHRRNAEQRTVVVQREQQGRHGVSIDELVERCDAQCLLKLSDLSTTVMDVLREVSNSSSRDVIAHAQSAVDGMRAMKSNNEDLLGELRQCRLDLLAGEQAQLEKHQEIQHLYEQLRLAREEESIRVKELHDGFECEVKSTAHEFEEAMQRALQDQKLELERDFSCIMIRERESHDLQRKQHADNYEVHLEAMRLELDVSRRRAGELEQQVIRLEHEGSELRAEFHQRIKNSNEEFKFQVVHIGSERDHLRSILTQSQERISFLENENRSISENAHQMRAANEMLSQHMLDVETSMEERLRSTQLDLDRLAESCQTLSLAKDGLEAGLVSAKDAQSKYSARIDHLNLVMDAKDRELWDAHQLNGKLRSDAHQAMCEVENVLSRLEGEVAMHAKTAEALDAARMDSERLANQMREEISKFDDWKGEAATRLNEARRSARMAEEELADCRRRIANLEDHRRSVEEDSSWAQRHTNVSLRHREDNTLALQASKARLIEMQEEVARMSSRLAASDAEASKLRAAHRDKDELLALLAGEVKQPRR